MPSRPADRVDGMAVKQETLRGDRHPNARTFSDLFAMRKHAGRQRALAGPREKKPVVCAAAAGAVGGLQHISGNWVFLTIDKAPASNVKRALPAVRRGQAGGFFRADRYTAP